MCEPGPGVQSDCERADPHRCRAGRPKKEGGRSEATRVIAHKTHLISTSAIFFPDLVILTAFEPADDDDDELPHKVHRP